LYWVKDMALHADEAPHRQSQAAANWSGVGTFFIMLAKRMGYSSIATAKRKCDRNLQNGWIS
jgi:hypothetical protein